MIKAFPHQEECLAKLVEVRKAVNRALVVMATGLGKTVTVALDVKHWLEANPEGRVLYVCHQNDILSQARATFEGVIGGASTRYGYYHGRTKERHAQFVFASFQTMQQRHLRKFKRNAFGYVVVDESHHTHAETYRPLVKYFRPQFLLGVTATPDRGDLQDIRQLFGEEVFSLNLSEALTRELLTPVIYRLVTDEIVDLGKIENPYRMTVAELNKTIFVPKRDEEIVRIIQKKIKDIKSPRIMVFCSSIAHAEQFHACMPGSIPIHSGLARGEQASRLNAFRQGVISTAITVDKFNEGIDVPDVNVVVFLRSTQSYTVFYQQLGRGLRRVEGKDSVLVLDFVGSCDRIKMVHRLSEDFRKAREEAVSSGNPTAASENRHRIISDFADFEFNEQIRNILTVLRQIEERPSRQEFTQEEICEQIRSVASILGHPPKRKEFNEAYRRGECSVPGGIIAEHFGSYLAGLRVAGLTPSRIQDFSTSSIVKFLKKLRRDLGRVPTNQDVIKAYVPGVTPSFSLIRLRFNGSFTEALQAARMSPARQCAVDTKVLKDLLREYKRNRGRLSQSDLTISSRAGRTASYGTIRARFKGLPEALELAGAGPQPRYERNDKEILKGLRAETRRQGRRLTQRDIRKSSKAGRTASYPTILRRWGGLLQALKAAGLK